MEVLVNGTPKEISSIFDNTGCDITEKFLKEAATDGKVRDFSSEFFKKTNKDLDIYVVNRNLPFLPTTDHPELVNTVDTIKLNEEKMVNMARCIMYNDEKKLIEMTAVAVKWWEQYAPKYNEVSALENRIFPHMQNTVNNNIDFFKNLEKKLDEPFLYYYERSDILKGRENPIFKYTQIAYDEKMGDLRSEYEIGDLHIAANEKGDWLRKYAETHEIDISDINRVPRLEWKMLSNIEPKEKDKQIAEAVMQLKAENSMLKDTIKKLNDVINRTNAIFKENPSLLEAFKQAKTEFMQTHNSKKRERPIDMPKQESKPHRHNKR